MKQIKFHVALLSTVVFPAMSAVVGSPAEMDNERFLRQSAQESMRQGIAKEKAFQSNREALDSDAERTVSPAQPEQRFRIVRIEILDDDLFTHSRERNDILAHYENTEMGKTEIMGLIRQLTNFYVGQGYTSTMVSLKAGNLRNGELKLAVLWGKINDFSIDDSNDLSWRQKLRLYTAMPVKKGDVLNMQDLDQGLDNMMKASPNTTVNVKSSAQTGYSDVHFNNANVRYASLNAGFNNSGDEERGARQYFLSGTLRNILGVNDSLSGRYAWYDLKNNKEHQYTAFGSWNFPVGYWNLDLSYLYSNYEQQVGGIFGAYVSEGTSERTAAKLSRMLNRNADGKLSGWIKVEKRSSANYIEKTRIDVSTKKYSNISTGLNYVGSALGGWIYADLSVATGRPWFDAAWKNDPDLTGFDIDFVKYNGSVNWKKDLVSYKRIGLQYDGTLSFQHTNDVLVSSEQFILGDEFTVRGYKNNSISGDSGAVLSSNINFPFNVGFAAVRSVVPFIGYDIGMVRSNFPGRNSQQYVSGASVGAKFHNKYMSASLTSSWPVLIPDSLQSRNIDRHVVYYNVNVFF